MFKREEQPWPSPATLLQQTDVPGLVWSACGTKHWGGQLYQGAILYLCGLFLNITTMEWLILASDVLFNSTDYGEHLIWKLSTVLPSTCQSHIEGKRPSIHIFQLFVNIWRRKYWLIHEHFFGIAHPYIIRIVRAKTDDYFHVCDYDDHYTHQTLYVKSIFLKSYV